MQLLDSFERHPNTFRTHRLLLALVVPTLGLGTACSIVDPLHAKPVRVDSIRVALQEGSETASVFVYGKIGSSGCDKLKPVRRLEHSDSLVRQFTAVEGRGLCPARPSPLRYEERVTRRPARGLTYIVAQPGQEPVSVQIPPL